MEVGMKPLDLVSVNTIPRAGNFYKGLNIENLFAHIQTCSACFDNKLYVRGTTASLQRSASQPGGMSERFNRYPGHGIFAFFKKEKPQYQLVSSICLFGRSELLLHMEHCLRGVYS